MLDRFSLKVLPGRITALVGESGSGESTIGLATQDPLAALNPVMRVGHQLREGAALGERPKD